MIPIYFLFQWLKFKKLELVSDVSLYFGKVLLYFRWPLRIFALNLLTARRYVNSDIFDHLPPTTFPN